MSNSSPKSAVFYLLSKNFKSSIYNFLFSHDKGIFPQGKQLKTRTQLGNRESKAAGSHRGILGPFFRGEISVF